MIFQKSFEYAAQVTRFLLSMVNNYKTLNILRKTNDAIVQDSLMNAKFKIKKYNYFVTIYIY